MMAELDDRSTLGVTEFHPAALSARDYLISIADKLPLYLESFSSCALGGNRLAEICSGTLNRLMTGKPVSDRYLLGLAWTIRKMEEKESGQVE
jgi:hypothetical protein